MWNVRAQNNGHPYILTVIDVLSKFSWAVPLKAKDSEAVIAAFKKIFKKGRKCCRLYTDRGREFTATAFQHYMEFMDVEHITTTRTERKAWIAERYNRTLKTRLHKYMTQQNTKRWLEVLPRIVSAINHSLHRSIKRRPVDVTAANQNQVWHTLYGDGRKMKPVQLEFEAGDRVRVARSKPTFEKGFTKSYSDEVFTVSKAVARDPPVYELVDGDGNLIVGAFYGKELITIN